MPPSHMYFWRATFQFLIVVYVEAKLLTADSDRGSYVAGSEEISSQKNPTKLKSQSWIICRYDTDN